jgi:ribosomal-protein-alanine N-acetyltransferase
MCAAEAGRIRLTERLRLEPVGPEHASDLLRLHQAEAVAEWYGEFTQEKASRRAREMGEGWQRDGVNKWMAYDRATGELVGRGGLSLQEVDGKERLEVGWIVHPDLWGQGYATEMGRAGLAFAFDELGAGEVVAFTEPENRRSRAVMERLGMRYSHEFVRHGIEFVLYTLGRSKTGRLTPHPGTIVGDPEDLVHLDWSDEWRP